MYEPHPLFRLPDDENAAIWRYMDITKLIALLDSSALYFTRTDSLGDPFEGSYPVQSFGWASQEDWAELEARRKDPNAKSDGTADLEFPSGAPGDLFTEFVERLETTKKTDNVAALDFALKGLRTLSLQLFVNCWHINPYESDAMWKIYLKSDEGISIRSTIGRLRDSFAESKARIFIGEVNYVDYDSPAFQIVNPFECVQCKRLSFAHERELRAVVWSALFPRSTQIAKNQLGISIGCDLQTLIEEIRVSPTAPEWMTNVVKAIVRRFNFTFPVEQSRLGDRPIW